MNFHELREAQARFETQIENVLESRKDLYKLRNRFARYYDIKRIKGMPCDHYAIGNDLPSKGYNFCYTLERELDGLGRIIGATSFKFGVYFGRTKSDPKYKYRFTKKFGATATEAYKNVQNELISLLKAGETENIEKIIQNKISPMFKGKILSTYFPERYLNIFSDDHLKYYLKKLNLDTDKLFWADPVIKREALIKFKNSDVVMKNWSTDLFSYFLYSYYPGSPPKENTSSIDVLKDYRNPEFPDGQVPQWIDMSIERPKDKNPEKTKSNPNKNPDYEMEAKKLKRFGDRGEKLVLEMERKRLKDLGLNELSKKIKKAKYDYLGYDIKSYEKNGDNRFIEVKATSSKTGVANFYLSENELEKANELKNYYIYMIFDILSLNPQIWIIGNPFKPINNRIILTPVSYKVAINAKHI